MENQLLAVVWDMTLSPVNIRLGARVLMEVSDLARGGPPFEPPLLAHRLGASADIDGADEGNDTVRPGERAALPLAMLRQARSEIVRGAKVVMIAATLQ